MNGDIGIAALPADVLVLVADAAKRQRAGEPTTIDALPVYQSVIVDAVLLEAATMAVDPDATAPIRAQVRSMMKAAVGNFVAKHAPYAEQHVLKTAERFGLIAAVGEFGIRFGVLPWATSEAFNAAGLMFEAWMKGDAAVDLPRSASSPSSNGSVRSVPDAVSCSETDAGATCHPIKDSASAAVPIEATVLALVLDRLDRPDVVTVSQVVAAILADHERALLEVDAPDVTLAGLRLFLTDRAYRAKIASRFAACGYEPARNAEAQDGLWKVGPARVVIYAAANLADADRSTAARRLVEASSKRRKPTGQCDQ